MSDIVDILFKRFMDGLGFLCPDDAPSADAILLDEVQVGQQSFEILRHGQRMGGYHYDDVPGSANYDKWVCAWTTADGAYVWPSVQCDSQTECRLFIMWAIRNNQTLAEWQAWEAAGGTPQKYRLDK